MDEKELRKIIREEISNMIALIIGSEFNFRYRKFYELDKNNERQNKEV